MKKPDKIAGIVSILAILCLVIYLVKSDILLGTPREVIFPVLALFLIAIFGVIIHYLIIGIILRSRIKSFERLAQKYSFKHSFVPNLIFIPYSRLNTLEGVVGGHNIVISDTCLKPTNAATAEYILLNQLGHSTVRVALNMKTEIVVDGKDETPVYQQKWIFYRNPFMKVSQIEQYLETIK